MLTCLLLTAQTFTSLPLKIDNHHSTSQDLIANMSSDEMQIDNVDMTK